MVLGLIGNVVGNLNQDKFVEGAEAENRLQALQRANFTRDQERFALQNLQKPQLPVATDVNQGMAGLNVDRFGGTFIDIPPPVTNEDTTSTEEDFNDSTAIDNKNKPVVVDPNADPNKLKPSDPVIIDEPNLSFPKVDPNQTELPPAATGRNKTNPERTAEINRRKTIDSNTNAILKQYGIRRKGGQGTKNVTKDQGDAYNFYNSKEFKDFIYQYPQYLTDVSEDPIGFIYNNRISRF